MTGSLSPPRQHRRPDLTAEEETKKVHRRTRPRWPRRLSREAEIRLIKQLPRLQKAILISKVSAVVLFAIGLEGLYLANWWMAGVFLLLGLLFTIWPVKMSMPNVCPKCGNVAEKGQTVCDKCGVALM